jgi:hypothetical protein
LQPHAKNKKSADAVNYFFTFRTQVINDGFGVEVKDINEYTHKHDG